MKKLLHRIRKRLSDLVNGAAQQPDDTPVTPETLPARCRFPILPWDPIWPCATEGYEAVVPCVQEEPSERGEAGTDILQSSIPTGWGHPADSRSPKAGATCKPSTGVAGKRRPDSSSRTIRMALVSVDVNKKRNSISEATQQIVTLSHEHFPGGLWEYSFAGTKKHIVA